MAASHILLGAMSGGIYFSLVLCLERLAHGSESYPPGRNVRWDLILLGAMSGGIYEGLEVEEFVFVTEETSEKEEQL